MPHNNKENPTLLNELIAAPNELYDTLLTNGACQRVLSLHLPGYLTRVNMLLHTIRATRSRKFRQRYIRELHTLMTIGYTTDGGTYDLPNRFCSYHEDDLTKLVTLCSHAVRDAQPVSPEQLANVRRVDITNSPWWSALQIGDSKHYTSCLRSGLQRMYPSPNPHVPQMTEDDWINQIDDSNKATGSNYSTYIRREVDAFKSGELVYYGIGTMPHEGGDGWLARIRVEVIDGDAYINEVYGDIAYERLLHAAVVRDFSNAYVWYGGDSSSRVSTYNRRSKVYTIYDDGDEVYAVNVEPQPVQSALTLSKNVITCNIRHIRSRHELRDWVNPTLPTCVRYRINNGSIVSIYCLHLKRLLGCMNTIKRQYDDDTEYYAVEHDKLRSYYDELVWMYYGVHYNYYRGRLTRVGRDGVSLMYNFRTGTWDGVRPTLSEHYIAPRRKVSWIVNTFMPKSQRKG